MSNKLDKFTDKFLLSKTCKGREKKFYIREGHGFTIRVMPSGMITFLYIYKLKKRQELNLGNYNPKKKDSPPEEESIPIQENTSPLALLQALLKKRSVTLAEARYRFNLASTLVAHNIDPKAPPETLQPNVKEPPKDITVSDLKTRYIGHITGYLVERSVKHHKERITLHIVPEWGERTIRSITSAEAVELLDKLVSTVGRGAARNVSSSGSAMFEYALKRRLVDANPFYKIAEAVPQARAASSDRVLKPHEIRTLWKGLSNGYGSSEVRRILKLTLLLGQRPGEVAAMKYEQIKGNWWIIPKNETKNGKNPNIKEKYKCDHYIFLGPHAKELIGTGTGFVFAPRGTPILETSVATHVPSEIITKKGEVTKLPYYGLAPWTPHDLRRTMSTQIVEFFTTPYEVVDAIQGHIITGVTGIYVHAKYEKQKEEYMTKWEKKVLEIVNEVIEEEDVSHPDMLVTRRVLSDEEIKKVWEGLSEKTNESYNALKFMLVTGQPPGKTATLHNDEIISDAAGKWWAPKEGNKVFLTKSAIDLICNENGYAFAPRGDKHINIATLSYHVLNKDHFGVDKWTPDDLRFTTAFKMREISAPAKIVDAIVHGAPINEWELKHWLMEWERTLLAVIS